MSLVFKNFAISDRVALSGIISGVNFVILLTSSFASCSLFIPSSVADSLYSCSRSAASPQK